MTYESCTGSFASRRGGGGRLDGCEANVSLLLRKTFAIGLVARIASVRRRYDDSFVVGVE